MLALKTLSLEDLSSLKVDTVEGASKHEQKISEAPAAVSIITAEDIKQFGYRTLGDLLQSVRGFYMTYDRAYNHTGLRGLNRPGDFGGRILINLDGHRLNDPVYDSAFTHTDFLLDLDLVERVEIIRGPGSSLYGNNAFLAVINVITRRGAAVNGVEVSGTAGSFDAYSGRVTYGKNYTNGIQLLLSATYLSSLGQQRLFFPEQVSVNQGIASNLDSTEVISAFGSVTYGDLTLAGGFIDRRKHSPTAQYGTLFNDPRFLNEDRRAFAELKYAHVFGEDWLVQARSYYDWYSYGGDYPYENATPAGSTTVNAERDQAQWIGGEASLSKTFWERHRITLGAELRGDLQLKLQNADVFPPATHVDAEHEAFSYACYAQDEFKLCDRLTLNAGLRYDHFTTFGEAFNPRGAVIYNPWRGGTFKFLYGEAFRAPNETERSYIQPSYKPNPNLQPETVRSYELVYEQRLTESLRFNGSLFLNQIHGLIGQLTDPADGLNYFDNLDQVEARGFEAELEGQWPHGWRTRISYTLTEARDSSTGRVLDNSPRHLGKVNLAFPLWQEKIFAGLEFQAMSGRTSVAGNQLGAVWLANATLYSRELLKNLEVSLSVYNLFDQKYRDPVGTDYAPVDSVQQDGRTLRFKATWKF